MNGFIHRKFTIFFSSNGGDVKSLSISGKTIILGVVSLLIILSTFLVFSTQFSCNMKRATIARNKKMKSEMLDEKMDKLVKQINIYDSYTGSIWDNYSKIAQLYDISSNFDIEKSIGFGGALTGEDGELMTDERMKDLIQTYYKLDYEKSNLEELLKEAELHEKIRKATPTLKPTVGNYTSFFGWRFGGTHFHKGLDIANKCGSPIYASADGVVTRAGPAPSYGLVVYINHGYGLSTRYGHLQKLYVVEGERVKRGQLIAEMGRSGWASGCHLHYEVRINNVAVDPLGFIIEGEMVD